MSWLPSRLFYGWRIASAGFGLQFIQAALIHQSFGAYVAVLREEFGWSKTALSAASAIQQLEGALLGPIQGWIIDRAGARGMLRVGVLLFGAGLMMLSQVESLTWFYLSFVVLALGASLGGHFPLSIAVVHWFEKKRARALSFLTLGYAVGGIGVSVVAMCFVLFGWRITAFGSGVLAILLGWPLAGIVKNRPRDIGEVPDGRDAAAADPAAAVGDPDRPTPPEFTARQALGTSAFWFISLGHAFAMLVIGAINVHAITHMKETLGYSVGQAALFMTLQTMAQIGGILLGWVLGDRFQKRLITAFCMLFHMLGLLLLTYASSVPMLVAFAVLNGVAWGLRGPFMQAMRADYFGRRSIGMIMGLSSIIVVLGQIGGPLFAGILADATGNYRVAFTVLALLAGVGSAFFYFAHPPKPPGLLRRASTG